MATAGIIDNSTGEAAYSGSWKAWLDGYGSNHTDTLCQQVTIPSTATSATLTYFRVLRVRRLHANGRAASGSSPCTGQV